MNLKNYYDDPKWSDCFKPLNESSISSYSKTFGELVCFLIKTNEMEFGLHSKNLSPVGLILECLNQKAGVDRNGFAVAVFLAIYSQRDGKHMKISSLTQIMAHLMYCFRLFVWHTQSPYSLVKKNKE